MFNAEKARELANRSDFEREVEYINEKIENKVLKELKTESYVSAYVLIKNYKRIKKYYEDLDYQVVKTEHYTLSSFLIQISW